MTMHTTPTPNARLGFLERLPLVVLVHGTRSSLQEGG
jgi:hypothetical protein